MGEKSPGSSSKRVIIIEATNCIFKLYHVYDFFCIDATVCLFTNYNVKIEAKAYMKYLYLY